MSRSSRCRRRSTRSSGSFRSCFLVRPDEMTRWLAAIAVATGPIFAAFIITRRRGALRLAERFIARIARMLGFPATNFDLSRNVLDIYQRRRHVLLALLLHLAGWFMSAVQLWVAAWVLNRPLSPGDALALQSLAYAARGAFFFVPWAARHSGRNFRSCRRCAWRRCCERPCVLAHLTRARHPARIAGHSRLVRL